MALTTHVFARVDGKLARWELGEPMEPRAAIDLVAGVENPPKPVLALIVGGRTEEKANADPS